MNINSILVEDDHAAADYVQELINQIPGLSMDCHFQSPRPALEYVKKHSPDVIFLDQHLPHQTGLEFAKEISELQLPSFVVFMTGDVKIATHGLGPLNVIGYLHKPFTLDTLTESVEKVKYFVKSTLPRTTQIYQDTLFGTTYKSGMHFPVKISYADIIYIRACKNYSDVVTKTNTYTLRQSLSDFAYLLDREEFLCFNRSCLVNANNIVSYTRHEILLCNEELLSIKKKGLSAQFFEDLKRLFYRWQYPTHPMHNSSLDSR